METGEKQYRGNRPIPRPAGCPPPCKRCPKCRGEEVGTPAVGRRAVLNERNCRMLARYHEHQAAGGPVDPFTCKCFGIIHQILAAHERASQSLLIELLQVMMTTK